MSLLDTASLIVTPNGYKEGKLYSVIPSDGSGDMSVVRATTATRVNSAGLVELVPYNLLEYSEDFSNAYWSTQDATITANTTTAPNGTLTADTFTRTASTGFLYSTNPLALITGSYAISVYAKANTISSFRLDLGTSGLSQGTTCTFDLSNGTAGTPTVYGSTTSVIASIENVGNGWYRCSLSANFIAGNYYAELAITTTGSIYAWGAQLVEGSVAKDYQKTETRLNIPRLDYSNGTCPSLLVEPQRTNISQYVESGDGNFNEATVTNATSIVGLKTFKVETNVPLFGDAPSVESNTQYQANTPYTLSFYTDFNQCNDTSILCSFLAFFPVLAYAGITINKATKAITTLNVGGVWTLNSYEAEQINGEIYRIKVTATPSLTAVSFSRNYIYALNNNKSADFAGIQLESGSYPTSFINKPTSASVTRNADVISKTGISSLIGQTEGTIYLDVDLNNFASQTNSPVLFSLFGNATIYMQMFTSGYAELIYSTGAGTQAYLYWPSVTNGQHKIAFGYKANDFVLYIDGLQIATDASGSVDTLSSFYFGYNNSSFNPTANYKAAALWKTRLTNTQLAQLTTI